MKSKPVHQKKLTRARKSCKSNTNNQSIYSLVLQLLIALTCSLISSHYSFSLHWLSYPALKQFLLNPSSISSFMSPKCLFIAMNIIVIILIAEWSFTSSSSSSPANIYDEYVKRSRIRPRLASVNPDLHEKPVFQKYEEEIRVLEEKKTRIRPRLASVNPDLHEKPVIQKPEEEIRVLEEKKSRIRPRLASVNSDLHEKPVIQKPEEEIRVLDEKKSRINYDLPGKMIVKRVEEEKPDEIARMEEEEDDDVEFIRTEELNKRVENFIARVNRRMWVEAHCVNVHGEEEILLD